MMMVSVMAMVCMAISLLIAVGLPIALLIVLYRKTRMNLLPALLGAGIFLFFVFVLEGAFNRYLLVQNAATSAFLTGNTYVYALYGGLAAGLFEETGRLLAFRLMKKRDKGIQSALCYGIGHGGIEAIVLVGLGMFSSLVTALSINALGLEGVVAAQPAALQETVRAQLNSLLTLQPHMFLAGGVERIAAIALQIALSVLVYLAVIRKGKGWCFPLAIGLHALIDFPAVLFQVGVITNIWLLEALVIVLCAGVVWLAWRLSKGAQAQIVT